jgi:hypothetical protein
MHLAHLYILETNNISNSGTKSGLRQRISGRCGLLPVLPICIFESSPAMAESLREFIFVNDFKQWPGSSFTHCLLEFCWSPGVRSCHFKLRSRTTELRRWPVSRFCFVSRFTMSPNFKFGAATAGSADCSAQSSVCLLWWYPVMW